MLAANVIAKKRDGQELSDRELEFLVDGFSRGSVADYQMSAFAMAVCLRGLSPPETACLTQAMLQSGSALPRDVSDGTLRLDKHSTGGLGDKVSLILAPLLAACGVHVPMISGRGLGLTGGTLDKLESIPGFRTDLSTAESDDVLRSAGAFIIGASESIAPADRQLYALRDVTGTVESIPLITASILSKKLAASLDALVMDVKVGSGAFMKSIAQARQLADSISDVAARCGLPTTVVLSDMDQPLGRAVGNAIEVNEALAVLGGNDDCAALRRVRDLTVTLAASALVLANEDADLDSASERLNRALDSGAAMERFEAMVAAQGGRLQSALPVASQCVLQAEHDGSVARVDCPLIGSTIVQLGGGRQRKGDPIDHAIGIDVRVRIGDRVNRGQPLLALHCHKAQQSDYAEVLRHAITVTEESIDTRPVIIERR